MVYFDRARAYLVENWLLVLSSLLSTILLSLHLRAYHPDPHLEQALDATVIVETKDGMGTGFFINPDGCVMTAAHVVSDALSKKAPIYIVLRGHGYRIPAREGAINGYLDIAIICSKIQSPAYLEIADTENIMQGEMMYAIGHPVGRTWNVTQGVISRLGYKMHHYGNVWLPRWDIWFSAFIAWGNSGGPIINSYGKVVGMVVEWDDPRIGKPSNMNIAVPGSDLKRFIRGIWGKY